MVAYFKLDGFQVLNPFLVLTELWCYNTLWDNCCGCVEHVYSNHRKGKCSEIHNGYMLMRWKRQISGIVDIFNINIVCFLMLQQLDLSVDLSAASAAEEWGTAGSFSLVIFLMLVFSFLSFSTLALRVVYFSFGLNSQSYLSFMFSY